MFMWRKTAMLCLGALTFVAADSAQEGPVPKGVPKLDHVFVIMMENHGYSQIVDNPNAPFINKLAKSANSAHNYFAIAHPSLTNYLEVVGGSNFGIQTDNYPDWHNGNCTTNLASKIVATDNPPSPLICPIWGTGTDATNETTGLPGDNNIDGVQSIPADSHIVGKTIADQLAAEGRTWRSYQESLPLTGADLVNVSDGFYTNNTDFTKILPALTPPLTSADLVFLYAVKHNPFNYFRDAQEGHSHLSLANTVSFEGPQGLYADLASGKVPVYSFIAPNQCNDQHGRGNAGAFCNFDPTDNGTQAGLNPAAIYRGDVTVQRLVNAIHNSPAWDNGHNAIVILWDENDYSSAPNTNQVLLIVDTNYAVTGVHSNVRYNHFSLLKTIEAGLELPCLNHACDSNVSVMADLFQKGKADGDNEGDDH
jgi:phosphatidylinositol-3-phosphatase